jgi:RNA polymerase sigma-70 factor (ECF subfamily)
MMRSALLTLPWLGRRSERAERDARLRRMVCDHFDFAWRSLVRLGVASSDADDAAQQVFLVANERLADIPDGSERAFLFGACLKIASRHRRTVERRRESGEPVPLSLPDQAPTAEELCDRQRARALLDRLLDQLPLDVRAVFILYELEQQTMAEIATTLGLPPGTVASRLRRAREHFEAAVKELPR